MFCLRKKIITHSRGLIVNGNVDVFTQIRCCMERNAACGICLFLSNKLEFPVYVRVDVERWQGCENTMPYLSDLVRLHFGQVRNVFLLIQGQV